jgi:hypothetical protein
MHSGTTSNTDNVNYILESNPHSFYSFRGIKNWMRITIECGLDSRSRAGFWKNDSQKGSVDYGIYDSPPFLSTCSAHLTILDMTILSILGEEYKLRGSTLYSLLQLLPLYPLWSTYSQNHDLKHPQHMIMIHP